MPHVLIVHEVENYEAWKRVFDNAAALRYAAGERSYQVLASALDANHVVHFSTWTSHEAARRFFESRQLVQIRLDAGVKAPTFHYLTELESGTLTPPR